MVVYVTRTFRDYMNETDRALAAADPRYEEAWRKTFAGQHAELAALVENLRGTLKDVCLRNRDRLEQKMAAARDHGLREFFKS